jgi:broad specificity phosphatase PhoE
MKRAISTAAPVIQCLEEMHSLGKIHLSKVEVVPHIFEVGGCYSERDGVFVGFPGMTDVQAKDLLPMAHVPESMKSGWWPYSTRETEEQLEARVVHTTEWIKKMACTRACDVLLIVSHQDFACICMRRLGQIPGINWLYNTSLSSFSLIPVVSPETDPESVQINSDGAIAELHHCKIIIDWINSVDHLSPENVA